MLAGAMTRYLDENRKCDPSGESVDSVVAFVFTPASEVAHNTSIRHR